MSGTHRIRLFAALCGLAIAGSANWGQAQEQPGSPAEKPTIQLHDESGSVNREADQRRRRAAELRQMRAWQRFQEREARIEAANRAGYHLSRPPAVAVPSMTSRYAYPRHWVVPFYLYPRY